MTRTVDGVYEYRIISMDHDVDGDTADLTVDLGFGIHYVFRCRFAGINCPEMATAAGVTAKAYTTKWFADAAGAELHVTTKKHAWTKPGMGDDQHGRWVGTITNVTTGAVLNADLVASGNAVVVTY